MVKAPAHVENNNQQRLVPRDVAAARLRRMRSLGTVKIHRVDSFGDVCSSESDVAPGARYYEIRGMLFTWAVRTYPAVNFGG